MSRLDRVGQLLKKEVGKIILKEIDSPDALVTVTRTDVSSNFQEAKFYISVIPENESEKIFKFLEKNIYNIQQKLNKRLAMRPVPKIIFKKEKQTKEAARIEKVLEDLKKAKKS